MDRIALVPHMLRLGFITPTLAIAVQNQMRETGDDEITVMDRGGYWLLGGDRTRDHWKAYVVGYEAGLDAGSKRITFELPPPLSPADALEIRAHVRDEIDERCFGVLRAAWTSYHALALGTGHCDPKHLDTQCLGCGELERLARPKS